MNTNYYYWRNINNLRYADDTTLMAESEEELKSLLMKVKEESEIASLKLNIQKTKIMASGPISLWELDGERVETVSDFIFWGSKITSDGDCNHDIKRYLLLEENPEKTIVQKYTCIPMFIEVLFTIARTWKQSSCSVTDEWLTKF